MVSRRNYFVIAVIMVIIFFLFQFSGFALEAWNDYKDNPYAARTERLLEKRDAYGAATNEQRGEKETILYIGNQESATGKNAQVWANYTKRDFEASPSLKKQKKEMPKIVVIDPAALNWENEKDMSRLEQYVQSGTNLIFCGLPPISALGNNQRLRTLLGIQDIWQRETTVSGIQLYEGFLLGGEIIYKAKDKKESKRKQDMELTFPWYRLASGTKAYMRGIPKEESVKIENYPPIIWKKSFGTASVFAVNGSYMEDVTGLGLLSAMAAETGEHEIYPIVNAQNMVVANYPGMAAENEKEINRRYSQPMDHVFRNIIWPNIIAVYQQNKLGLSCMIAPQFDYADNNLPQQSELIYYMKLLNQQDAEAGLSGTCVSSTAIEEKLEEDRIFMEKSLDQYRFTSFYAGKMSQSRTESALREKILEKARTVVQDYDGDNEILGYMSDTVTKQTTLADGLRYTYGQDFRTRSIETALGYSSVLVDVARAAYPQDKSLDTWKDIAKYLGADIDDSWKNFQVFSGTTVSECDERIRNFLALDYTKKQNSETISLEIKKQEGPVWFLLRSNKKPADDIQGGSWKKIEDGAYLIEATDENVIINMEPAKTNDYLYQ